MSVQAELYIPAADIKTDVNNMQSLMNRFPIEVGDAIVQNTETGADGAVDWITPEEFNELVNTFIQKKTEKFQAKALITSATYKEAVNALQNKNSQVRTPSFRFWARKRFVLQTRGEESILCAKDESGDVGKPVCIKENLYSVLTEAHMACDHKGRDPTYDCVKKSYSYIPKEICDMLVKKCKRCGIKRKQKTDPSPPPTIVEKPLLTYNFMACLHIHLIDYTDKPSMGKTHILYVQDNFSKYIWAYTMKAYTPEIMAKKLNKIFCQFGTPLILQTRCQYVTAISTILADYWPGLKMIHAKSEIAENTTTFESLLSAWMTENNTLDWAKGIDKVCYQMNTTCKTLSGKVPYEIVFGRLLRNDDTIWNILLQSGIQTNRRVVDQDEISAENQKVLFEDKSHC